MNSAFFRTPRRMQRAHHRGNGNHDVVQATEMLPDGGYRVLHPTRGWRKFSKRRLDAIKLTGLIRNGIKADLRKAIMEA